MGHSAPFQIFHQGFASFPADLIGDQNAFSLHVGGNLGRFAPGGGTQVEYFFPGSGLECLHRGHGTGVLNIVEPGGMIDMLAGSVPVMVIEKTCIAPGDRLQMEGEALPPF